MSVCQKAESHGGNRGDLGNVGTGQSSNGCDDTPSEACAVAPGSCPRYTRCSAPICPLDADWRLRRHLEGESVCGLVLELAKDGGEATLRASLTGEVVATLATLAPSILAAQGPVRRAYEKASKTGSRLRSFAAQRSSWAKAGEANGR